MWDLEIELLNELGFRKDLEIELLNELKTLCEWLKNASRGEVTINIQKVNVGLYHTFAEGEAVNYPVYVEDVSFGCELLIDIEGIFNDNFIRIRADLLPKREKIESIWVSPPDEADINLKDVEDKKIKKEKTWIKEMWDIAKSIITYLVMEALKRILGIP